MNSAIDTAVIALLSALVLVATIWLLTSIGWHLTERGSRNTIALMRSRHGIVWSPLKAAYLFHRYRWPSIPECFGPSDVFFCGFSTLVLQFFCTKVEPAKPKKEPLGYTLSKKYNLPIPKEVLDMPRLD